ncbi:MAG: superoxide dismutase, partial [Actinomycetota bacterium]
MAFELPPLAYPFDALEPHIDAATMEIHHDRHHQAYVDNANAALAGTEWESTPVEELLTMLDQLPADKQGPVRNNAGGHANHTLFWEVIGPNGGGAPSGDLAAAIDAECGGLDALKAAMTDAGIKRFGSGWSWLV